MEIAIPAGAFPITTTITYQPHLGGVVQPLTGAEYYFALTATDSDGRRVRRTEREIELRILASGYKLRSGERASLYAFDETSAVWSALTTTTDPAIGSVRSTSHALAAYALRAQPAQSAERDACIAAGVGVGAGIPPAIREAFVDECELRTLANLGNRVGLVTSFGGAYEQEFAIGTLLYVAGSFYFSPPELVDVYRAEGGPAGWLGAPLNRPSPASNPSPPFRTFQDEEGNNFTGFPVLFLDRGFIGKNIDGSNRAHRYFPSIPGISSIAVQGRSVFTSDDPPQERIALTFFSGVDPAPRSGGAATVDLTLIVEAAGQSEWSETRRVGPSSVLFDYPYQLAPTTPITFYLKATRVSPAGDRLTGYAPCDAFTLGERYAHTARSERTTFPYVCLGLPSGTSPIGPLPPALLEPPSAEEIQRWRDLGFLAYQRYGMDPVSFSTGNHILQLALARIPGRGGLDVDLTLTYSSQDQREDILGYGWTFPYNMRIRRYADESVGVVHADGRTDHYTWDGNGYDPPAGVYDELERSGDGWTLTSRDRELTWVFEETITGLGVLKEWRDRRGNTLTFTHDLSGENAWHTGDEVPRPPLTGISDAAGRTVTVIPDGEGRIEAFELPDGRRFDFEYDGRGDLVAITDANTPVRGTHRFKYDNQHQIEQQWDPEGILFLTNIYDDGQVVKQLDASDTPSYVSYNPLTRTTVFTDNLGFEWTYQYDELNRVVAETDPLSRTVRTVYNEQYHVTERTDARGNTTYFEYDARDNLVERRDPIATVPDPCRPIAYTTDTTTWEYNGSGDNINLPTVMVDTLGERWEYEYDGEGNLTRVTDPISSTLATYDEWGQLELLTDGNGHETEYIYDTYGNLELTIDALDGRSRSTYDITGRELTYTDANSNTVTLAYNGNDQIVALVDPKGITATFTYDRNDLLLSITDRAGTTRSFRYDENLKLTGELDHPAGAWETHAYDELYRRVATTDRNGHMTVFRYDKAGQLEELIDARGDRTRYGYDNDGNLTEVVDAAGGGTGMAYDEVGRLTTMIDAAGDTFVSCYDAEDRLVHTVGPRPGEVTSYAHDALGRTVVITDALGAVRQALYDPVGNQIAAVDPLGNRSDMRYDKLDRLVALARPALADGSRPTTGFTYDGVGNTTVITSPRGFATTLRYDKNDNLEIVTDPLGGQTIYAYDLEDRPLTIVDPNGNRTSIAYDPVGNPIAVTNGAGETTRLAYDAVYNLIEHVDSLGRPTTYDYDERNDLLRMTDPLDHATSYQRDALGRVAGVLDALGRRTGYSYDPVGRLLAVTDPLAGCTQYDYGPGGALAAITDANNHTTRFSYSSLGQLTGEVNPIGERWRYSYDAAGRMAERIDALGRTTFYEHDSNDRLIGVRYSVGPRVQAPVLIDYDLDGNELRRCNGVGCVSHEYDPLGRPIFTTDWEGRRVGRSYDAAGNLAELLYPGGRPVRYAHDEANRLAAVTLPGNRTSRIERDGAGRLTQIAHPNSTVSSYAYDEAGRLTAVDHRQRGSATPQTAFAYVLDRVGNRTAVRETRAALNGAPAQVGLTRDYGYDDLDRLVRSRSDRGSDAAYRFDPAGNRLALDGTTLAPDPDLPQLPVTSEPVNEQYSYNEANQLTEAGADRLEYNANGERVRETQAQPGGGSTMVDYRFDLEGRVVGVTAQVSGVMQMEAVYEYDGYGRRARKTINYPRTSITPQTTTFLYDGLEIIGARVEQGSSVRESHVYLMPSPVTGMRRPFALARLDNGAAYWFQADGLDSIVGLTDHNGNLAGQMVYGDYGQQLAGDSALQLFTYTAQDYDAETGLLHFHARLYDPVRGVWLSQDPYRGELDMPVTQHRYGYVGGNPVNLVDVLGFKPNKEQILNVNIADKQGYSYSCNCGWIDWGHAKKGSTTG